LAARCSLAILFSNPRKLRLRRKPDPLSLGPFDPQSASADWGSIFYIKIYPVILISKSCVTWRLRLPRHGLRIFFSRVMLGMPYMRVGKVSSKK
jgi:hypothetical protein